DVLELGRWNLRRLDAPPRVHQLRRAEQAADNLAARFSCAHRATVAAPDLRRACIARVPRRPIRAVDPRASRRPRRRRAACPSPGPAASPPVPAVRPAATLPTP